LFAAMVALAAVNRLSLTTRLNPQDALNVSGLRSLRRNATLEFAAGMIVVAVVGELGTIVPAAHQSPVWPFDFTLSWQAAQQSFRVGVGVVAAGTVACLAAGVAIGGMLRERWRLGVAGFATIVAIAALLGWLLAVPAYPTTYAASPVRYTTASIARGAGLYAESCIVCHGPYGRGDGPAAASLPRVPADLAAHSSSHLPGELFWWIAHGIPGAPMPGFAPRLGTAEIWDLVQFLRAQSDAAAATTLTGRAQPWRSAIVAPDFTFELDGQGRRSLRQPQRNSVTLLTLYTLPQSMPYLRACRRSGHLRGGRRARHRHSAVWRCRFDRRRPRGRRPVVVAITSADAVSVYAMYVRQETEASNSVPAQVDYLIDRQRLRSRAGSASRCRRSCEVAEAFDQAELLRRERQRPVAGGMGIDHASPGGAWRARGVRERRRNRGRATREAESDRVRHRIAWAGSTQLRRPAALASARARRRPVSPTGRRAARLAWRASSRPPSIIQCQPAWARRTETTIAQQRTTCWRKYAQREVRDRELATSPSATPTLGNGGNGACAPAVADVGQGD
jgi:mono/diheme cytochrome c family protein